MTDNPAARIVDQINDYMNPGITDIPQALGRAIDDSFHRSLDRALSGEPRWPVEPLNLLGIQDEINSIAVRAIRASKAFILEGTNAYDPPPVDRAIVDGFIPQRFMCGIAPTDPEAYDWGFDRDTIVTWADPQAITLETRNVDIETLEIAVGMGLIPLCARQIPAQGVE